MKQTDREEREEMLRRLIEVLPTTWEDAVPVDELADRAGMTVPETYSLIQNSRRHGVGVCEVYGCYWMSRDPAEIQKTASRLIKLAKIGRSLDRLAETIGKGGEPEC